MPWVRHSVFPSTPLKRTLFHPVSIVLPEGARHLGKDFTLLVRHHGTPLPPCGSLARLTSLDSLRRDHAAGARLLRGKAAAARPSAGAAVSPVLSFDHRSRRG